MRSRATTAGGVSCGGGSSTILKEPVLARLKGGARKVIRVSEVLGTDPSPYDVRDIFGYRQHGVRDGAAFGEFYATGYRPRVLDKLRMMGIDLPDEMFRERVWAAD